MPPQQGNGLLDIIDGAGDFGAHGGGYKKISWEGKDISTPLSQVREERWPKATKPSGGRFRATNTCSHASRAAAKARRTGGL
jgi:hypothetical protein